MSPQPLPHYPEKGHSSSPSNRRVECRINNGIDSKSWLISYQDFNLWPSTRKADTLPMNHRLLLKTAEILNNLVYDFVNKIRYQ